VQSAHDIYCLFSIDTDDAITGMHLQERAIESYEPEQLPRASPQASPVHIHLPRALSGMAKPQLQYNILKI